MFIDFRERKRERSVASHMHPDWGLNMQTRCVPWLGIEPATFWYMGQCSNQLSHMARAGKAWGFFFGFHVKYISSRVWPQHFSC